MNIFVLMQALRAALAKDLTALPLLAPRARLRPGALLKSLWARCRLPQQREPLRLRMC